MGPRRFLAPVGEVFVALVDYHPARRNRTCAIGAYPLESAPSGERNGRTRHRTIRMDASTA